MSLGWYAPGCSRTYAELCGRDLEGTAWAPGTSFGSGDSIGFYLDLDESKLWIYKNGIPLDPLPGASLYRVSLCLCVPVSVCLCV